MKLIVNCEYTVRSNMSWEHGKCKQVTLSGEKIETLSHGELHVSELEKK